MNSFINTFLNKFCAKKDITNRNVCTNRLLYLSGASHSYATFLSKLYSFILKQGIKPDSITNFEMVASSGDSLILLYPNLALKLFSPQQNENESVQKELKHSKIFSPFVVNVIDSLFEPDISVLAYEKVLPLTKKNLLKYKSKELLILIKQIGEALDFLMTQGYEHGDPGHSNIAFSPRSERFILIDLEDIKLREPSQNLDLRRFLEDLDIQFKEDSENVDPKTKMIIEKLLEKFNDWYKIKEEEITFLGKKKKRTRFISEYHPGDLTKFLRTVENS